MKNNNKIFEMPCITTVSPGAVPVITMLCRTAKIGEIVNLLDKALINQRLCYRDREAPIRGLSLMPTPSP